MPTLPKPSSAIIFLRVGPVVCVKYSSSVRNSIAPASGTVMREPEVNLIGAVVAAVVPALRCTIAVGTTPVALKPILPPPQIENV